MTILVHPCRNPSCASLPQPFVCILAASNVINTGIFATVAAVYVLAHCGASGYFFRAWWSFNGKLRVHVAGTSSLDESHLRRMSAWLAASGICMMLYVCSCIIWASSIPVSPATWFLIVALGVFGRAGTSFTQVMSLNLPSSAPQSGPYHEVMPRETSTPFLLQHLIIGQS